jgi:hypothetical protein
MSEDRPPTLQYETPPHKGKPARDGGPVMLFSILVIFIGLLTCLTGLVAQRPRYIASGVGVAVVGMICGVPAVAHLRRRDAR